MIAYFLLGLFLFVGLLLLLRWASTTEPRNVLKALAWTAGILGVIAGLFLLWAGRYALAWIALPALIGLLSRWRQIKGAIKSARGPSRGNTSAVETRFLAMTLDHDTGEMSGEVREGAFAGRRLETLSLDQLLALWREVSAEDAQSQTVLEAYLDKLHGAAWREAGEAAGSGAGGGSADGGGAMRESEALEVLGLEPGASPEEVRRAYRQMMQKLHPDHGGSDWVAAKLNEAKRVLIGE